MFTLNVKLAGAEGLQSLFYTTEEAAHKAADDILANKDQHSPVWTTDDRGHTLGVIPRNVISTMVTDLKRDIENQGDLALIQMREQAKLQSKVSADPAMRFMQGMQQGGLTGFRQ